MTLTEAAQILNTSNANLRGAIKRGSLKATKFGRDWSVTTAEVARYQRENRRGQGEPAETAPEPVSAGGGAPTQLVLDY